MAKAKEHPDVRYSVVVPVFRSAATLRELCFRVKSVFESMGESFEIVLVEDSGGDASWDVMQELHAEDQRVRIARLARNFGQHNALMCGFSLARAPFVITMDDDLQNPPEEIPKLIQGLKKADLDVVIGVPEERQHSLLRNMGSALHNVVVSSGNSQVAHVRLSSFRIIRRELVEALNAMSGPNPVVGLMLLKLTDKIGNVIVEHHERSSGRSTYTPRKLIRLFAFGLFYHSDLPLKGILYLGVACLGLSLLLGLYYLLLSLAGAIKVSGWTTIVLLILFFSGTTMLCLGVIGEYLRRILQEVRGTPAYVIREKDD